MPSQMRPHTFHGLIGLAAAVALTIALVLLFRQYLSWHAWLLCWLAAVNVVAFAYYGYDKRRAQQARSRVPEIVLHGLALAGGTLGAYLGMRVFRHKTIKGSFRVVFAVIAVLQVLLVIAVVYRMTISVG